MLASLSYSDDNISTPAPPLINLKIVETVGNPSSIRDDWMNKLINGDNLAVLTALLSDDSVCGKVRLIYIDPPFSTGQLFNQKHTNEIAYDDTLQGPAFLNFLKKRLFLLKELLADDGSIYVHIDTKIGHYVKILMDEVFGQDRFVNDITRIKCNPKNFERKAYGNYKDMILFYSKTSNYIWNDSREEMTKEEIERLFPKIDKDGRHYTTTPLHAPGITQKGPTGNLWKGMYPPKSRHWRYSPNELSRLDSEGLIEWSKTGNPRLKIYADDAVKNGKKRQDIWEFKDPPYPDYPTEKNLEMLKVIINTSSNKNDIVLDAFCGSGSTLHASQLLERKWIGIDASPIAIKTARQRLMHVPCYFNVYDAEVKTMCEYNH